MIADLRGLDRKVYSQNGEDGILAKILETIGTTNKYFVEFGVEDGSECNTRLLRENGWHGLMMDMCFDNPAINLHQEQVTVENVNQLFQKYRVPGSFDVLSIDVDYNDLWVWKAIVNHLPRVVVIEWHCGLDPAQSLTVPYDPSGVWDGTPFHGASFGALKKLGQEKKYHLVASDAKATNLFFVHDSALGGHTFYGMDEVIPPHPEWVLPADYKDPKGRLMQAY